MLWARMLADLIVVFHAAYVSFVVFGLVAILLGVVFRWSWVRNLWFRAIHLTVIGIVVARGARRDPLPADRLGSSSSGRSAGQAATRATSSATGRIG